MLTLLLTGKMNTFHIRGHRVQLRSCQRRRCRTSARLNGSIGSWFGLAQKPVCRSRPFRWTEFNAVRLEPLTWATFHCSTKNGSTLTKRSVGECWTFRRFPMSIITFSSSDHIIFPSTEGAMQTSNAPEQHPNILLPEYTQSVCVDPARVVNLIKTGHLTAVQLLIVLHLLLLEQKCNFACVQDGRWSKSKATIFDERFSETLLSLKPCFASNNWMYLETSNCKLRLEWEEFPYSSGMWKRRRLSGDPQILASRDQSKGETWQMTTTDSKTCRQKSQGAGWFIIDSKYYGEGNGELESKNTF